MKQLFLGFIRFYQKTSWFHGSIMKSLFLTDKACRFTPTCSEYCYQAVDKYGIISGSYRCFKRVLKCNPLNEGGKDPLK